jgi:hypothetical protein
MFVSPDVWAQWANLLTAPSAHCSHSSVQASQAKTHWAESATSWNGNPMGLQLVVDSNFAAKTMIITRVGQGQGDAFEFYESIRGLLERWRFQQLWVAQCHSMATFQPSQQLVE